MAIEREASVRAAGEHPGRTPAALGGGLLLAVAVVLTALNLRPAITSAGAVLDEVRDGLGASDTWAGALTTLPGLCFAVAGLAAPRLARRVGLRSAVAGALVVLGAGLVLRVLNGPFVVLGGTLIACTGIALANVLIPVVVKASFATRVGLMTGVYTAALQAGGALGSSVTPPLDSAVGGWRGALASWAALAAVAVVVWLVATRTLSPLRSAAAANPGETPRRSLLRVPLAWVVTVFFGCQACLAYIVMGWLPQVLMDAGVSRGDAGLLLGLVSLLGLPVSLTIPALAARRGSQSGWIVGLGAFGIAGILGLMLAPAASPVVWSVLLGIGMSVFSLALTTIALRARDGGDTAALSGMAQGLGYLLAALGPFLFGLLHDLTGGWTVPFAFLLAVVLAQCAFGYVAGRPRYV
ncbi:MFS transporter [Saccharomonospora piscinae]|uniref:MFS transporter n=1 Tax=Saccharomonospora piscinae TaxID=687388 RepID=A0A1V8ZWM6_SACPI|nr:MFS transporter [Saccharomonospora piscinae]OQO89262.1 MFS transporter [Saccharomonospora piscinae]TLW90947.1 MFS transporter [Saccharomonospora piscinae]